MKLRKNDLMEVIFTNLAKMVKIKAIKLDIPSLDDSNKQLIFDSITNMISKSPNLTKIELLGKYRHY